MLVEASCSDNNANLLAFESTLLVGRPFDVRHFNFSCLEAWYVYSPTDENNLHISVPVSFSVACLQTFPIFFVALGKQRKYVYTQDRFLGNITIKLLFIIESSPETLPVASMR